MSTKGLTTIKAQALLSLSEIGSCNLDELNDRLFIEKITVTRILDGLAKKGWVKKERGKEDRRIVTV